MTLNDAQEAIRFVSTDDQANDNVGLGLDYDENHNGPAKETAWDFHDTHVSGRRDSLSIQTIQDLCTIYDINEPANLVDAKTLIEDEITSSSMIVELSCQLADTKESCSTHKKEHETEVTPLNDQASVQVKSHRKTTDTFSHALSFVASLDMSLRWSPEDVCRISSELDAFHVEWQQTYCANVRKFTSTKHIVEKMRGLLAQAHDVILQLKKEHEEHLSVEKGRTDSIKAQVTDFTGQMMKVEELLCTSRSEERMESAEVKTLDVQPRAVLDNLRTFWSKIC